MKNFAKFLVVALAVSLIAGMFAFSASAVATEPGANPNDLKPGSDRVIFIQDPERDPETHEIIGELPGDGSGTTPENPLATIEHDGFNASAEIPKYHLTTSFYQATEMLKETGGTIVITGPIYFGEFECYGAGKNVRDVFTAEFKNNVIKFTSVYNGVDYRETNGAKITIETPAMLSILGSSIWENIDFETTGTDRCVTFDEYCTLVGEGVKCYPSDLDIFEGIAPNYVSLAAGHRYAKSTSENPTLLVKSGTYNKICGGMWGTVASAGMEGTTTTNLTIEGTTEVLGVVSGSVGATSPFSGNVNVTINGGVFMCDINGVGPTGLTNTDGTVTIKINGGDFKQVWSINDQDITNTGNAPAFSSVDFSGWTGEKLELAYAVAMVTEFKEVKLPEGMSVEELKKLAEDHPPVIPEDTDEVTLPPVSDDTTKAPEVEDTTKAPVTTAKPETTSPETTAPANDGGNGGDMTLWIILGVVAVVAVAAVVVVVLMKKKAAK